MNGRRGRYGSQSVMRLDPEMGEWAKRMIDDSRIESSCFDPWITSWKEIIKHSRGDYLYEEYKKRGLKMGMSFDGRANTWGDWRIRDDNEEDKKESCLEAVTEQKYHQEMQRFIFDMLCALDKEVDNAEMSATGDINDIGFYVRDVENKYAKHYNGTKENIIKDAKQGLRELREWFKKFHGVRQNLVNGDLLDEDQFIAHKNEFNKQEALDNERE